VTTRPTTTRLLVHAAVLLIGSAALSGCAPQVTPTPTPTPVFASEDEAFAAAEEVYREFIRRLNDVDLSDTNTFEPLFELSSGSFEKADREAYSAMHAEGYVMHGETRLVSFEAAESPPPHNTVVAHICLDVSSVSVVDSAGVSQVEEGRPDLVPLEVTFVADRHNVMLIDSAVTRQDASCNG